MTIWEARRSGTEKNPVVTVYRDGMPYLKAGGKRAGRAQAVILTEYDKRWGKGVGLYGVRGDLARAQVEGLKLRTGGKRRTRGYIYEVQPYDVVIVVPVPPPTLTSGHSPAKIDADTPTSPILQDGPKGTTMAKSVAGAVSGKNYTCGCGCGELVTRRFKPGHDARLKGEMLRAYRSGDPVDKQRAQLIANDNGWERYLTDQPAKATKVAKTKPVGFAAVRVKVGRWEYDGILIEKSADEVVVEYKGAGGKVTRKTLKPTAIVG